MNRIETMRAAAEDPSHWWWEIGTAPSDLRDVLAVIDAARAIDQKWHERGDPTCLREALCDALVRLRP